MAIINIFANKIVSPPTPPVSLSTIKLHGKNLVKSLLIILHKGRCQKHPEGGAQYGAAFGRTCVLPHFLAHPYTLPPFLSALDSTPPIFEVERLQPHPNF